MSALGSSRIQPRREGIKGCSSSTLADCSPTNSSERFDTLSKSSNRSPTMKVVQTMLSALVALVVVHRKYSTPFESETTIARTSFLLQRCPLCRKRLHSLVPNETIFSTIAKFLLRWFHHHHHPLQRGLLHHHPLHPGRLLVRTISCICPALLVDSLITISALRQKSSQSGGLINYLRKRQRLEQWL